jgi:hypothetical protein
MNRPNMPAMLGERVQAKFRYMTSPCEPLAISLRSRLARNLTFGRAHLILAGW